MKLKNFFIQSALAVLLTGTSAFAQTGGSVGGGGEDGAFKAIRDEITVWMQKNLQNHTLSKKLEIQDSSDAVFYSTYDQAVKTVGDKIFFTHDEIKIEDTVKICKNDKATFTITCNIEEWNQTRGDTRYMIVLHEYLGIMGLESNSITNYSQYPISPKILRFVKIKAAFELALDVTRSNGPYCKVDLNGDAELDDDVYPCIISEPRQVGEIFQQMLFANRSGIELVSKKTKAGINFNIVEKRVTVMKHIPDGFSGLVRIETLLMVPSYQKAPLYFLWTTYGRIAFDEIKYKNFIEPTSFIQLNNLPLQNKHDPK